MGLLEDAIREHLELKRLRGADPAEVAREQREALEAPAGEATGALAENHTAVVEDGTGTAGHEPLDAPAGGDHPDAVPESPVASDLSHAGQETAELDMKAVMAEKPANQDEHAPPEGSYVPSAEGEPSAVSAEEDSLEWEVPARAHDAEAESGERDGQSLDGAGETAQQDVPHAGQEHEDGAETQDRAPGQGRLSL
jgi:hypothetical protein